MKVVLVNCWPKWHRAWFVREPGRLRCKCRDRRLASRWVSSGVSIP